MTAARAWEYTTMVQRNAGYVTGDEQARLRRASAFVCGVGGMGGIVAQALVRAGVGRLVIADTDRFETSNLNRQVYATLDTLGAPKAMVTARQLRAINPALDIEIHGETWTRDVDAILHTTPVVVNAMDDIAAGVHLYRRAGAARATVIDAYTSSLPSVIVVRPSDPRPEERLGFPTLDTPWTSLTAEQVGACRQLELEYVLVHSTSLDHMNRAVAAELVAGRRARPSFAPTVWLAGALMALEAIAALLGQPAGADCRGVFLNPWTARMERPRSRVSAWLRRRAARRFLSAAPGAGHA